MDTLSLFAGNQPPKGWMFCEGQQLGISLNAALYSVLGNTFGGDQFERFMLPDLRDAVPGGTNSGLHYMICVEGQYPADE